MSTVTPKYHKILLFDFVKKRIKGNISCDKMKSQKEKEEIDTIYQAEMTEFKNMKHNKFRML